VNILAKMKAGNRFVAGGHMYAGDADVSERGHRMQSQVPKLHVKLVILEAPWLSS
jgi:hypothetical protein